MKMSVAGCALVILFACPTSSARAGAGRDTDLDRLLKQEASILDTLDDLVFGARAAGRAMRSAREARTRAEQRVEQAAERLEEAKARAKAARLRLGATLRLLAAAGPADAPVSALLYLGDERATRLKMVLDKLAARQAAELRELVAASDAAVIAEFVAGIERANAYAALQAEQEAARRMERDIALYKELLAEVDHDRRLQQRRAREITQAQKALVREIGSRLSKKTGPVRFDRLEGRLRLPLAGALVAVPFGDVVHPRFKTVTPHPGVTLAYPRGDVRNVRSVAFGRVAFVGRMRGYGLTVVVDHASGYYTVYAGLADVKVREGRVVREGEILGRVTREPGAADLRLYFELRRGRDALDPVPYFKRRSG